MTPEQKLYLRLLRRNLECAQQDLSDVSELANKFSQDFQQAWGKVLVAVNSNGEEKSELAKTVEKISEKARQQQEIAAQEEHGRPKKQPPKEQKDVFKKISMQAHPDRVPGLGLSEEEAQRREALFIKAQDALDNEDMDTLFDVAMELGIELSDIGMPYTEAVEKLEGMTKSLRKKIEERTKSVGWAWGLCAEDIDKKVALMKSMLHGQGRLNFQDELIRDIITQHQRNSGRRGRKTGQRPEKLRR